MISDKYTDIKLNAEDMIEIEAKVEEYNQRVYQGAMDAYAKGTLRQMLVREMKDGLWSNRDYVYGQDEGEPNAGDVPN